MRPELTTGHQTHALTSQNVVINATAVEVMGRYLNPSDQGERLRQVLEIVPSHSPRAVLRTPKRVCRRLEPVKVSELVTAYQAGASVAELTKRYQIDRSTVMSHLDRAGIPRRWKKLQPVDVQEAKRLYASGLSLAKVAEHFGVYASTVHSPCASWAHRCEILKGATASDLLPEEQRRGELPSCSAWTVR